MLARIGAPRASPARAAGAGVASRPWRRLLRHHLFWLGSAVLVFLILFSFLGPDVWRRTAAYNVAEMLAPPGAGYPLGADALGRDNLWELMLGGRLGQVLNLVTVIGIAVPEPPSGPPRLGLGSPDPLRLAGSGHEAAYFKFMAALCQSGGAPCRT